MGAIWGAALAFSLSPGGYAVGADQAAPSSMEQKILGAKSKTDHKELAAWYEKEAKTLQTAALAHKEMAKAYDSVGYLVGEHYFVRHCKALAQNFEGAAKENLALAEAHRRLAEKRE